MNPFEIRALEIAQNSSFLASIARPNTPIVNIDFFAYNVTIGSATAPIAPGGAGQGLIQIQSDSDFVITYMTAYVAGGGLTVQITDTGSGKTFMNQPTFYALVFGYAGLPFLLPQPRVVQPATNIKLDVVNVGAVNMTGAFFSFSGARIYYGNA